MSLNTAEILTKLFERLNGSTELEVFVGDRISGKKNQTIMPSVKARLGVFDNSDTKTELGYTVPMIIDVWSDSEGDLEVLTIADIIKTLFHRNEFTGMTFQCIEIAHINILTFLEPDEVTTHAVINFEGLFTE